MIEFVSEVELGLKYRDNITGVVGTATAVSFDLNGPAQAMIEYGSDGKRIREWIDQDRLEATA